MTGYYLPHDDPQWEDDAERAAAAIRAEIASYLRSPDDGRPLFVGWVRDDGLDPLESPLGTPDELSAEQQTAHDTAVDALIGFLEYLDIDQDVIEARVYKHRDDRASVQADEERARRKENW